MAAASKIVIADNHPMIFASIISPGPSIPIAAPIATPLNTFDPKIVPIIISDFPLRRATIEATYSGRDVPIATRLAPTNPLPTPHFSANPIAPSVIK